MHIYALNKSIKILIRWPENQVKVDRKWHGKFVTELVSGGIFSDNRRSEGYYTYLYAESFSCKGIS